MEEIGGWAVLFGKRGPSIDLKRLIYEEHFNSVYRVALYITHDQVAAEDVAHETFKVAFERYHELREPARLGAWLRAIAANLARSSYNSRQRVLPSDPTTIEGREAAGLETDELLERQGLQAQVRAALQELDKDSLAVLVLKYYDEYEIAEIADLLGVPIGTVKSRLSRARAKLRGILERKGITGQDRPAEMRGATR